MRALIFLLVLLQIQFLIGKGPTRMGCQNIANFNQTDVDHSIDAGIIATYQVKSPALCGFECLGNDRCLSYNYEHESSSELHSCELVDRTKIETALTVRAGYTHYETVKLSCDDLVCENGGSCVHDCRTGESTCYCTPGFEGLNCSIGVLPVIEIHPKVQVVTPDDTVILDCYSSRAETIKWAKSGYLVHLADPRITILANGSLEIKQFSEADNGDYWCIASNPNGERSSYVSYVGIMPTPSGTIRSGDEVTISTFYMQFGVELSKFTTLDDWFKDDVRIDFATSHLRKGSDLALVFSEGRAQTSDAGVYHFTASNAKGTAISNKIVVHFINRCPVLNHPTNGVRRGECFEGNITVFFCYFRFTLSGNENLECLSDGTWNGDPPTCSADTSGNHPVRLVDGPGDNAGRVEIYSGGKWGAVGDEGWDINDGNVVCKELGFEHALEVSHHVPPDYPQVFLNNVQCTGSEAKLSDCTASYDTLHASNPTTAGVVCQNVRLVAGGSYYGRLEAYTGGRWGTVCDDLWDMMDTQVVCRQLGFTNPQSFGSAQGAGTGDIVFDNVECSGSEMSITHCSHLTTHNCGHGEDISVACEPLKLVDSPRYNSGRVEYIYNEQGWHTACDDDWGDEEAEVVCRQLGFPGFVKGVQGGYFPPGTGTILLDNTACTGSETNILSCPRASTHNCAHSEDAGVICQPHVRLAGSTKYYQGRVEAYKDGSWGTVCDHMWDIADADVVCRMLGFDGAYEVYTGAYFGEGVGTIHYNGLQCNGNETRILHCPQSSGTCTHANDAGVRCKVMRLAGGPHRNEGRVELFKNDTWGTVCDPDFSSLECSQVAGELSRSVCDAYWSNPSTFGSGTGDIQISDLACAGESLQDSIFDCPHSEGASQCTHSNDVSMRTNTGVKVYDNREDKRGAVGVFREKAWSYVCANDWDIRDAHVVCREMKLPDGAVEATTIPRESLTSSTSLPLRGGYRCDGYESNIEDCKRGSVPSTCPLYAGVVCQTLRLAEGPSPHEGLLQVYEMGFFGGICKEYWDIRDAHVACIQLGFGAGAVTTHPVTAEQVRSSGNGVMTNVYCKGLEKNIFDCPITWGSCPVSEEVWVECVP